MAPISSKLTFLRGPIVISPQWSPDGQRLVFSSQAGGNRDIYTVHADGSKLNRVTSEPSLEDNPAWSRDGRWIYFRSNGSGISQIWRVSATGGGPLRVTAGEAAQGFESPDGKRLYFVRSVDVPGLWSIQIARLKLDLVAIGSLEARHTSALKRSSAYRTATFNWKAPLTPWNVAVMVAEPLTRLLTVTAPPETVAIALFEDVQFASDVVTRDDPSENRAVATKDNVAWGGRAGLLLNVVPVAPVSVATDTDRTLGPLGREGEPPQVTVASSTKDTNAIL